MSDEGIESISVQAFVYGVATLLQILLQVATMMYVSRALGPELYGLYNLSLIPLSFLLMFSDLGFNAALFRYSSISHSRGDSCTLRESLLLTSKVLVFVNAVLSTILLLIPGELSTLMTQRNEIEKYVMMTALTPLPSALSGMTISLLAAIGDARKRAILQVSQSLIKLASAVVLISLGFLIEGVIISYVLSYIVIATISMVIVKPFYKSPGRCYLAYGDYVRFAFSMFIPGFLMGVLGRMISIKLAYMTAGLGELGNYIVGNFNASSAFIGALLSIYASLATPLLPYLSYQVSVNNAHAKSVERLAVIFNSTLLPLSIFALFFSDKILGIVYGAKYSLAPLFFTLMALPLITYNYGMILSAYFQVINDKRIITINGLATFVVGVIMLEASSRLMGINGIALTVGLYQVFSHVFFLVYARLKYQITLIFSKVAKTILASIVANSIVLAFNIVLLEKLLEILQFRITQVFVLNMFSLISSILLLLLLYAIIMALLRSLDEIDVAFIEKMLIRVKIVSVIASSLIKIYKSIYYRVISDSRREKP
ncbi:MAG: oligosaccharide flippase family protein [Thermosphaera sp.]